MAIKDDVRKMKQVSPYVAASSAEARNKALEAVANALVEAKEEIFAANAKDLDYARENAVPEPVIKRLKFDEKKLADVTAGIRQLCALPDPIGRITLNRQMDEDLILKRITCPIGVIGVIFEARPDAMIQISCLCIKSGNCAVLKGGKETANTNKTIFDIIYKAVVDAGLPEGSLLLAQTHSEIDELLDCDREVDLLIPRGSNAFVRYIMEHTKIPVMGHADGICHIYVDKAADLTRAIPIILDAKLQYTAACNAVETLLIHKDIAKTFLPELARALAKEKIGLRVTGQVAGLLSESDVEKDALSDMETVETDAFKEYLAPVVSVAIVDGVEEAVAHINRYGSHHTDSILTEDDAAGERFMQLVDSAGVYRNCSTRFSDGFRYGFGAEVGISTGKIHARGPVGLEGLVTYKYRLYGKGQIVGDYAEGRSTFKFKDL